MSTVHDTRLCALGEGPLWHPLRAQLFWFDILGRRLLTRGADGPRDWAFDRHASAAGWIDADSLLIATETDLIRLDLASGAQQRLVALEEDRPETRSNDGRADPQGGFWIGTMGKAAEPGAGAIYRYHRGQLRRLVGGITIPNAICFAPDGRSAFYTDTPTRRILRQPLDAEGWPEGDPRLFVQLDGLNPDGAVVDRDGNLWVAQWGAGRVACHGPDGRFLRAVAFPAVQTSCPAFGGPDLRTLFCTSARDGLAAPGATDGATFAAPDIAEGQAEHRVIL